MSDPLVSIIMRSFNEGWALHETLPALQSQEFRNWELIVIDSGSTDGSVELIRKASPRHFIQIQPHEYNPSRVMNHGMELARSDFGIFLNADATPQGTDWLRPLVNALFDPQVAAVFGKQVPRPDCKAVFAHDYERCFGEHRDSEKWEHFFSMVSSGIRKDVWSRRKFQEQMQYSEDDEWTRWWRAQGRKIIYVPKSVVMHSHNYTPAQAYKRSFGEARALAAVWTGEAREFNPVRTVFVGWLNDLRRDIKFCEQNNRLSELPHAARIRWNQRRAKLAGFRDGWKFYRNGKSSSARFRPAVSPVSNQPISETTNRFTLDGSEELENYLARICQRVVKGVRAVVSPGKLETILLGGGYGRGEGGVLRSDTGDRPYNDLEFYVFVRGNTLVNSRCLQPSLNALGEQLSREAGLHVEFKIDSLKKFSRAPVTMFSHDLMSGHKTIFGNEKLLLNCDHHFQAEKIPLSEATRLLFNRCSGLLLAKELLTRVKLSLDDADFIGRNIAKAQLAFGDAVLVAQRRYHWSCRERHQRLLALGKDACPWLDEIKRHHASGMQFKLHPHKTVASARDLEAQHHEISELGKNLWLWIESQRLKRNFSSALDYALCEDEKCFEKPRWKNYLLNVRTFGVRSVLDGFAGRYPRERLFNALTLLLWDRDALREFEIKEQLRDQLQTKFCDWNGLVAAYKTAWPNYG